MIKKEQNYSFEGVIQISLNLFKFCFSPLTLLHYLTLSPWRSTFSQTCAQLSELFYLADPKTSVIRRLCISFLAKLYYWVYVCIAYVFTFHLLFLRCWVTRPATLYVHGSPINNSLLIVLLNQVHETLSLRRNQQLWRLLCPIQPSTRAVDHST